MYTQCKLKKKNTYQVSYIPSEYAVVGQMLGLREDGKWSSGWTVEEVYGQIDKDQVTRNHATNQRFKKVLGKCPK